MITAEGCRERRERLWASLRPKPGHILLAEPIHLAWLTGFYVSPFVFRTQSAPAYLLLDAGGASTLVADNILRPLAVEAHVDEIVAPIWYRGTESAGLRHGVAIDAALELVLQRSGANIAIDSSVPALLLKALGERRDDLEFSDVSAAIHQLRRCKIADEIETIRFSIRAMEAGLSAARQQLIPGMTEMDAFAIVQQAATESAGMPVLVYGDFVSGPRTEQGGGPPSNRIIEANDLILLDFSVVIQGYRGDFASTFVVDGGKPAKAQARLAETCLESLAAGESMLRAGTMCRDVDAEMRKVYLNHGLSDAYGHHLGHGLGLGHPDPPYIVPHSSDTLQSGDVITLEPGQYVPGVGGVRFERNYLIADTGYELLTHHRLAL